MASNIRVEEQKKKAGFFQWLLVIVVPLIFAITIALIILTIMGVDVVGKSKGIANQIPFVASWVTTDEEKSNQKQLDKLQAHIDERDIEIEELSGQVLSKEKEIDELKKENTKLSNQVEELQMPASVEENKEFMNIASTFKDMEPAAAAPIIASMEDQELATSIMKNLPNKERGAIFEVMTPEEAANITKMLLEATE